MVYEDFTTYTEVDPNTRLTQIAARSSYTGLKRGDGDTYLYKDYGAGYFGLSETIEFTHEITDLDSTSSSSRSLEDVLLIQNVVGTRTAPYISVFIIENGINDDQYIIRLRGDDNGGSNPFDDTPVISAGTPLYYRLVRDNGGKNLTLYIYTDAARTVLWDTLGPITVTNLTQTFQYLMTPSSRQQATDPNDYSTGYIENLDLNKSSSGTAELFSKFIVRHSDTQDLFAEFIVQHIADLFSKFEVTPSGSADLFADFTLRQGFADLKAIFVLGGGLDLKAVFIVTRSASIDLFSEFDVQPVADLKAILLITRPASTDLFADIFIDQYNDSENLMAKTGIRRIYNLSDSGGIGFYWEGIGKGHVDIQIITPSGAWIGKFPDYANWTWVALKWEDLQEVDLDGSRPDKTQITGLLWTVHSPGVRHLDSVYGLPKGGDPDIFATFIVKNISYADLLARFRPAYDAPPVNLFADFRLRQGINNLKAIFTLRQDWSDLKAVFEVGNMIETYSARGTTNLTFNGQTTFIDLEEMEITINDIETDDEFILLFDLTLDSNSDGKQFELKMIYNLGAGDVDIGDELLSTTQGTKEFQQGFNRRLVAPSDGDYTFKIQIRQVDTLYNLYNRALRNFIIMHIH